MKLKPLFLEEVREGILDDFELELTLVVLFKGVVLVKSKSQSSFVRKDGSGSLIGLGEGDPKL